MNRLEQAELKKRQFDREVAAVTHSMEVMQQRIDNSLEKKQVDCLPFKTSVMKRMISCVDGVILKIIKDENPQKSISVTYSKDLIKTLKSSIDLSTLICDFLLGELAKEPKTITVLGNQLGRRIIRAYQMAEYIRENKHYYEEMTRFLNDHRLQDFDQVYKRFTAGANVDMDSLRFDKSTVEQFGASILYKILDAEDSFVDSIRTYASRTRQQKFVYFKPEIYDMMSNIMDAAVENTFDRIPCILPPREWKKQGNNYVGGFYSDYMRESTTIQLGDRNRQIPEITQPYLDALNHLQNTEYSINTYMYNVIKDIFINNLEIGDIPRSSNLELTDIPKDIEEELERELRQERRRQHVENVKIFSKGIALHTALKQCEELKNDSVYFVHSLDYRGRLYCMSNGLTTQGADYIKALIQFKEPKAVGSRGLYWLKVRAANTYGYDKASLDERVAYIDKMIEEGTIENIAKNPILNRDLWSETDKPLQFLATAYELATAYKLSDPTKHMSRLPVGLDGACNGSQHLAVLSNDEVLAESVNVTPTETFQDIYQNVVDDVWANMFTRDMNVSLLNKGYNQEEISTTLTWLVTTFDSPPRKLVKRCVMTLPYGSTARGRMDFIRDFVNSAIKNDVKTLPHVKLKNKMVAIIAYMVDKSLVNKTGGAIASMKFLQNLAKHQVNDTGTFKYTTPLGLEVDNFIPKIKRRRVRFMTYRVSISERTDKPNLQKIMACSAPNYIHSMDACHLTMTINNSGINNLMAIHDDIGTYPSETQALYDSLRKEFRDLYKDKDYFNELGHGFEKFNPLGEVDIESVLKSQYFFG